MRMIFKYLLLFVSVIYQVQCSVEEEALLKYLFNGYNKLIRPVRNSSEYVLIKMDLVLLQLINVYEKEQIMKTNVWINLKWADFQLTWNTEEFHVSSIRVPYDKIWTPDIVLFNNADGNYEASYKSNAVLYASGPDNIAWIPPAIYKSSCTIDVTFFPFDEQICEMRFGSWTFDATQVRLVCEKPMANFDDYLTSGTWDVIEAPSETLNTTVDGIERMELIYKFRIRRKTLFYTVNLIIPTVLISFLSLFVFYLPTDEGEKMTLCISILLALVVFLLLVSKILPPTSVVIPLISKYLLFTFIMNIVTILNTVIIINWNYRTPRTHNMPSWVRCVFINFLPKVLLLQRPKVEENNALFESFRNSNLVRSSRVANECEDGTQQFQLFKNEPSSVKNRGRSPHKKQLQHELLSQNNTGVFIRNSVSTHSRLNTTNNTPNHNHHNNYNGCSMKRRAISTSRETIIRNRHFGLNADDAIDVTLRRARHFKQASTNIAETNVDNDTQTSSDEFSPEILEAADKVVYITNHIKSENDYQEVRDDWKYVALVIDRLQLYIFLLVTVIGTAVIILKAPHIFEFVDQQEILRKIHDLNNVVT